MRWFLVILLFAIPAVAQAPSGLQVDLEGHAFGFGPESWKAGYPVDDQTSFTEALGGWSQSLGTYLDVEVRAEPRTGAAQNDWQYQAYLTDGNVEVEGLVTPTPAGRFTARFDVDGQRALPGMAAVPGLTPGAWTLRVRATTTGASGEPIPEGSGQTTLATQALTTQAPMRGDLPLEHIWFPAALLPHITEVGPGAVWLNRVPQPSGVPVVFEAEGVGRVWRAFWMESGGRPNLPVGTPGPTLIDEWLMDDIPADEEDGRSVATFSTAAGTTRLAVVSVVDPVGGGSAAWALAISDDALTITGLTAPPPGQEGAVTLDMDIPALEVPALSPGIVHALSLTPGSTTQITSGQIIATSQTTASASLDGSALRTHQGPYRTVSLLHGAGDYTGHVVMDRGLDATLGVPTLGVGTPTRLVITLASLSDDGRSERNPDLQTAGTVTITIGDEVQTHDVQVLEGGTIGLVVPVTPAQAGMLTIQALVDTGDTYTLLERSEQVLDAEAYAQEQAPWYDRDRYVPGPPLAAVLLGLAYLGRKR